MILFLVGGLVFPLLIGASPFFHISPSRSSFSLLFVHPALAKGFYSQQTSLQNLQQSPTPTIKACHICGEEEKKEAVVHAILFWMATCGHCHYVLTEILPPLEEKYGTQLQILKIEVSSMEDFDRLYQAAQLYNIPKEKVGVPFLVIGDQVLIGSRQIPDELPGLIKMHLAQGGLNYPDKLRPLLPEIAEAEKAETSKVIQTTSTAAVAPLPFQLTLPTRVMPTSSQSFTTTPSTPMATQAVDSNPAASQRPQGFELALTLEIGMVLALIWSVWIVIRAFGSGRGFWRKPSWFNAIWIGIGFAASTYLAYVEIFLVKAVCGPVGDCNAVQLSSYSRLFGLIPLGVLGMVAYLAFILVWGIARQDGSSMAYWSRVAIFGMALFGVAFSICLTYLELYVINAICAWCLTSALMMTLILLWSTPVIITTRDKQNSAKVNEN
ncbi:MAG: vitamin K epoxide reductase family protein [Anaerolineales bacterium]